MCLAKSWLVSWAETDHCSVTGLGWGQAIWPITFNTVSRRSTEADSANPIHSVLVTSVRAQKQTF